MNEKRWVTLKDGRRIQIDTNKYMNDKIRGNKKKYTEEDINVLREHEASIEGTNQEITSVRGYELNGIYLLKQPIYGTGRYNWIINKTENQRRIPPWYQDKYGKDSDNIIDVKNYKEGKAKLIELANKKK